MLPYQSLIDTLLQTILSDPHKFNHFMILGYFVMWLIAIIYILTLANRQRNVREEVKLLQELLKEDEEATDR